jgi:hypothetical protein
MPLSIRLLPLLLTLLAAGSFASTSAPDFTLTDTGGKTVKLSDFRGKYVVLEWTNPECPFVRKHYNSGNMQGLAEEWGAQEVVWLTVNSTNQSSYEYKSPAQMGEWMRQVCAAPKLPRWSMARARRAALRRQATAAHVRRGPSGNVSTAARSTIGARRIPRTPSSRTITCAPRSPRRWPASP